MPGDQTDGLEEYNRRDRLTGEQMGERLNEAWTVPLSSKAAEYVALAREIPHGDLGESKELDEETAQHIEPDQSIHHQPLEPSSQRRQSRRIR